MEVNGFTLVVGVAALGGAAWLGKKAYDRHVRMTETMDDHEALRGEFDGAQKATKAKFAQLDQSYEKILERISGVETVVADNAGEVSVEPLDAEDKIQAIATEVKRRKVRVHRQPVEANAS